MTMRHRFKIYWCNACKAQTTSDTQAEKQLTELHLEKTTPVHQFCNRR